MATPPSSRQFRTEQTPEAAIVRFTTRRIAEEKTVQAIEEHLVRLVEGEKHRNVILNLGSVESMDSLMVSKLITLNRKVKAARGHLALCHLQPKLAEVFQVLQLPRLLHIYGTEPEALASLPKPAGKARPANEPS